MRKTAILLLCAVFALSGCGAFHVYVAGVPVNGGPPLLAHHDDGNLITTLAVGTLFAVAAAAFILLIFSG